MKLMPCAGGAINGPEINAQIAFVLHGVEEHALVGQDFALRHVIRRAVLPKALLMACFQQADAKLKTGLAAAYYGEFTHVSPL
jgi:hypothetical protein